MLQRFIERYQLWSDAKAEESRGRNPLGWIALVALLLIVAEIYTAFTSHHVTWRVLPSDAVVFAFLVLYVRHSVFAWFIIPLFGAMILVESPFVFFISSRPLSFGIRLFSFCFFVVLGLATIAYGFAVRRTYQRYLNCRDAAARDI